MEQSNSCDHQVSGCQFAAEVLVRPHFKPARLSPFLPPAFWVTYNSSSTTTNGNQTAGQYKTPVKRTKMEPNRAVWRCFIRVHPDLHPIGPPAKSFGPKRVS